MTSTENEETQIATESELQKIGHEYVYILIKRSVNPEKAIFIDDNFTNSEAAKKLGIYGIHYKTHKDLINHLQLLQLKF